MSAHLRPPRAGEAPTGASRRDGRSGRGWRGTGRVLSMLRRMLIVSFLLMLSAAAANAAEQPAGNSPVVTGLFLTTKYPALTIRAGETTTIDVSVRNFKLAPQFLNLSVPQVADGWKATVLGGGQPIGAVEVAPDSEERLQL